MDNANPELGRPLQTGPYATNVVEAGTGPAAVVLLHGSGAGVTAWANWRGLLPTLADRFRAIAYDLSGFGYTERAPGMRYDFMDTWIRQLDSLLDELDVGQADLVGNSFGGAVALHYAHQRPDRVRRLVLMGSAGVPMALTPALDSLWGYTPSVGNMRRVMETMAFDRSLVTDDLAQMRYEASFLPGVQEAFAALFPYPRQRWLDAMALPDAALGAISSPTLLVHGREDRIIPLQASYDLLARLPDAQLHVFGRCGHWTMVERRDAFNQLVLAFLG